MRAQRLSEYTSTSKVITLLFTNRSVTPIATTGGASSDDLSRPATARGQCSSRITSTGVPLSVPFRVSAVPRGIVGPRLGDPSDHPSRGNYSTGPTCSRHSSASHRRSCRGTGTLNGRTERRTLDTSATYLYALTTRRKNENATSCLLDSFGTSGSSLRRGIGANDFPRDANPYDGPSGCPGSIRRIIEERRIVTAFCRAFIPMLATQQVSVRGGATPPPIENGDPAQCLRRPLRWRRSPSPVSVSTEAVMACGGTSARHQRVYQSARRVTALAPTSEHMGVLDHVKVSRAKRAAARP
jgi:hypothetical protein